MGQNPEAMLRKECWHQVWMMKKLQQNELASKTRQKCSSIAQKASSNNVPKSINVRQAAERSNAYVTESMHCSSIDHLENSYELWNRKLEKCKIISTHPGWNWTETAEHFWSSCSGSHRGHSWHQPWTHYHLTSHRPTKKRTCPIKQAAWIRRAKAAWFTHKWILWGQQLYLTAAIINPYIDCNAT